MSRFKKRVGAAQDGDGAAKTVSDPTLTNVCCVCKKSGGTKSCGKCKSTRYCSRECQKEHFRAHKVYCSVISDLEEHELKKLYRDYTVREEEVDVKTKKNLMKLIGEKPMLRCSLDTKEVNVLWDTGSMISLVDAEWVKSYFPNKKLHSVSEFLGDQVLQIHAANSTEIPFKGVLLFNFTVKNDSNTFTVPFLVTTQTINEPILGYNVIEHLVLEGNLDSKDVLKSCFVAETSADNINSIITVIQDRARSPDTLGKVKVYEDKIITAGSCSSVKCRVKVLMDTSEQTILDFVPKLSENCDDDLQFSETLSTVKRGKTQYVDVMNPTKKELILKKGTIIGDNCGVGAVI